MRRMILALALLALPVGAWAGSHRAGAGGGGGGANKSTLHGVLVSGELVVRHFGEHYPRDLTLSAVGEFAHMRGDHDGEDFAQSTFVVGWRLTLNSLKVVQPFGHAMVGGYWAEGENSSATVLGAGLDFPLGRVTADTHPHLVFRAQYDKYWINAPEHSYPQLTGQIIYRFE